MMLRGDYDDAVNVVDVWLQEHPEPALWEREETIVPTKRRAMWSPTPREEKAIRSRRYANA